MMPCTPISLCELFTAEWLTAIGTVGATVVALVLALRGQQIARWFGFHPVLSLKADVRLPDAALVGKYQQIGSSVNKVGESWYFRLAITNEGSDAARDVQVFLAGVQHVHGKKITPVTRFTPMNLRWTNTDDERTSSDRVTRPVLLADTPPILCDLIHIVEPKIRTLVAEDLPAVPQNHGVLALDLQVPTYSKGHLLEPGSYLFDITLAASNCSSTHHVLEVSYSGLWSPTDQTMFNAFKMHLKS